MKWIAFDGWGVVYTERDDVGNQLTPFVLQHNPSETYEHIREAYTKASVGEITAAEFWAAVGLGNHYPQIQEEFVRTRQIFDEQFPPIAEQLQKRFGLGLLSNDLSEWSLGLRKRYGIEHFFQVIAVSDEAHSRKPDHGIYEVFLRRAGCEPSDCLFIDDRLRNLRGAAEVGMRTCWFDRTGEPDADFRPDVRVQSLAEIPTAINNTGWQV